MYPYIKRAIDVIVSLVLIVLFIPVWLLSAIAVKLSSPGPTFFIQTRGGRAGRPFMLLKFRTMRADHVHDEMEIVPLSHSGITMIGRVLRRTKIDELPQLFNVFAGDMSLIGPRPTIMPQILAYDDFERQRLNVRPGITGLAQVNSNATMSWSERIPYDVYYVHHYGLLFDLLILAKTVIVVLLGEKRFSRQFSESPYGNRP